MTIFPSVQDYKLQACCECALNELSRYLRGNSMLKSTLIVGNLAQLLVGKLAERVLFISSHEWDVFAEALSSVDLITKNRVLCLADREMLNHSSSSEAYKFWRNLYDVFRDA